MKIEDEKRIERLSETFAKHARDHDDLQNEMAGRDVGRIERFLPGSAQGTRASERKRAERAEALTRLQLLMANRDYAAQYAMTTEHLNDAQDKLDKLLERVDREIEQAQRALEDKRDRAARLEDGTRVYRDKNGKVRKESGNEIPEELAAGVMWNGDEPAYESILEDRERIERLRGIEADIHTGQSRIGEMQEEMKDKSDPRTVDGMQSFRNETDGIVGGIEARLDAVSSKTDYAPEVTQNAMEAITKIAVPEL